MNTNTNTPLTVKEANEIGGAIQELSQLAQKAIVEKDDAAKRNALTSFVQDKLLLHAVEFLAAWFTMEQEYKPIIQAQATMFGHVLTIIQRREQIQQAQQQQQQTPVGKTSSGGGDLAVEGGPNQSGSGEMSVEPANVIQLVTK